jgi:hypothetical protein
MPGWSLQTVILPPCVRLRREMVASTGNIDIRRNPEKAGRNVWIVRNQGLPGQSEACAIAFLFRPKSDASP